MKKSCAYLFTISLLLAGSAKADTVTITFTGPQGSNYGGFYTGIYNGAVNGKPALFVCDDFNDEIFDNEHWRATVNGTPLFNPESHPSGFASMLTQQQDYNMVEFLATQIFADPNDTKHENGYLSWAIWALNSDKAWFSPYFNSDVQGLIDESWKNRNVPTPGFTIYTPVGAGYDSSDNPTYPPQEFLTYDANRHSPTPEPASLLLFGSGLLGLARSIRKLRRG